MILAGLFDLTKLCRTCASMSPKRKGICLASRSAKNENPATSSRGPCTNVCEPRQLGIEVPLDTGDMHGPLPICLGVSLATQ